MSQPPLRPHGPPPHGFGRPPAGVPAHPFPNGLPPYLVPREHPQGTMVLIFGILGLFCTPLGFVAWYLGSKAEQEIEISGQVWSNLSSIRVGKILGMVTGILTIVSAGITVLVLVVMLLGVVGVLSGP